MPKIKVLQPLSIFIYVFIYGLLIAAKHCHTQATDAGHKQLLGKCWFAALVPVRLLKWVKTSKRNKQYQHTTTGQVKALTVIFLDQSTNYIEGMTIDTLIVFRNNNFKMSNLSKLCFLRKLCHIIGLWNMTLSVTQFGSWP